MLNIERNENFKLFLKGKFKEIDEIKATFVGFSIKKKKIQRRMNILL